jgi:hypothetical protein
MCSADMRLDCIRAHKRIVRLLNMYVLNPRMQDEVQSAANLGIAEAVLTFRPDKGKRLSWLIYAGYRHALSTLGSSKVNAFNARKRYVGPKLVNVTDLFANYPHLDPKMEYLPYREPLRLNWEEIAEHTQWQEWRFRRSRRDRRPPPIAVAEPQDQGYPILFLAQLCRRLTNIERHVLHMRATDHTYEQIVEEWNRRNYEKLDCKAVDNALCRVKKKAEVLRAKMAEKPCLTKPARRVGR